MARETVDSWGPLLLAASGRDTISVANSVKRLAPENVFVIQIQHPRLHLNRFDLVITPRHDYYPLTPDAQKKIPWYLRRWITPREPPGRNVVLTVGALHLADSSALRVVAYIWHDELGILPKRLLLVNVGGPSKSVNLNYETCLKLRSEGHRHPFCLLPPACPCLVVSTSKILLKEFSTNPKVQIRSGEGRNPHMGHLAWADAFVITADSVSMLSETCRTGKPAYVIASERCTWKFADLQRSLQDRGVARPFTGKENTSESWSYPPLNDTAEAASQVIAAIAQRGWTIRT